MFPKAIRKIDKKYESISMNFLRENLELILDRTKCVGCGICSRVCPKEAISRGPIGGFRRSSDKENIIPNLYDPEKCVYCGTCVYMCPFNALTLKINGEGLEFTEIPIVKEGVVPKLKYRSKKLKTGRVMRPYLEGNIDIDTNKCPGGCSTCVEVCPSEAITVAEKPKNGWEISEKIHLDSDNCVYCGACDNACPVGAIKLEITKIKTTGEYLDPFWSNITEKIKKPKLNKEGCSD